MRLTKHQEELMSWAASAVAKSGPDYGAHVYVGDYLDTRETGRGYPIYIVVYAFDGSDRLVREIGRFHYVPSATARAGSLHMELQRRIAALRGNE